MKSRTQVTINSNFIREWCQDTFPNHRIVSAGRELVTNSIFEEDRRRHLSINLETGLWQDFKSGNKGNFIRLFSAVNGITYQEAQNRLLTKHLDSFTWDEPVVEDEPSKGELDTSHLIPVRMDYPLKECASEAGKEVWSYLWGRQLFSAQRPDITYYFSNEEPGRAIIPYEYMGNIFFYQARTINDSWPKYTNPGTEETGMKASNILLPYDEEAKLVVVCEGPLDAKTLQLHGINATCTQGSHVSLNQAEMLRDFKGNIIMGYDTDEAGVRGTNLFNELRKELRMPEIFVCPPPAKKDWNRAHVDNVDLVDYLNKHTTSVSWYSQVTSKIRSLPY